MSEEQPPTETRIHGFDGRLLDLLQRLIRQELAAGRRPQMRPVDLPAERVPVARPEKDDTP